MVLFGNFFKEVKLLGIVIIKVLILKQEKLKHQKAQR